MNYKPQKDKRKIFLEERPELSKLTFDEMSYLIKSVSTDCINNFSTTELIKIAKKETGIYC